VDVLQPASPASGETLGASIMQAVLSAFNRSLNNYQALTANNIALSFSVLDGEHLKLNEVLEVDLPQLVATQQLIRIADGKTIRIRIGAHDLHDLNLPMRHGSSRTPSSERLTGGV
jgi:hypothetical protein